MTTIIKANKIPERIRKPGPARFSVVPYPALGIIVYVAMRYRAIARPDWLPFHDTLTQYTEFLYAFSAFRNGELPLWNSYLYGGQPFYLMLNHGLLLNPIMWLWFLAGAALHLSPQHIFVFSHLTEAVFFAFGGYYLVREMTGSKAAGGAAFLILLFSGGALYWPNQAYGLAVVLYVPWALLFVLRYAKRQTVFNAVTAALSLAVSANMYYPVYAGVFLLTMLVLAAAFYLRVFQKIDYAKLLRHSAAAVPLLAVLLLPTWLAYSEISRENYQISRFSGPDQRNAAPAHDAAFSGEALGRLKQIVPGLFVVNKTGYTENVPLVGALGLALMLAAAGSFSRQSLFWLCAFLVMSLHLAGPGTPVSYLSYHLVPYYKIVRSSAFFSGFLILPAAVLAGIGAQQLATRGTAPDAAVVLPALFGAIALVAAYPGANRTASLVLLGILTAALLLKSFFRTEGHGRFQHLLLGLLLLSGGYNLYISDQLIYHNLFASGFFSYTDRFNFSLTRPERYTARQLDVFANNDSECCTTFYHVAEKIDGPSFFDIWGSPHTLFVSKEYYRFSALPGFGRFMREKFHFFKNYIVGSRMIDYGDLARKSVMALDSDELVRNRSARLDGASVAALPERAGPRAMLTVLGKTANTLAVSVNAESDLFLLYTDLYHDGFTARIDGANVPLLRGMGIFKAVEVPAGRHVVEFVFRPWYRYPLLFYLIVSSVFIALAPFFAGRSFPKRMAAFRPSGRTPGRERRET